MMDNSLFSVLLFTTVSKDSSLRPSTVGVTGSDAAAPTHSGKENDAGNRLVKDLQHLAAYVEGSQLPQEIESVHSLGIRFPVQSSSF